MSKPNTATETQSHVATSEPTVPPKQPSDLAAQRNLFVSMALNMSWQLAVVVIVPIVGGYMLDQRYHFTPWLTLTGLVVAAIGVFGVLSRTVAEANEHTGSPRGSS